VKKLFTFIVTMCKPMQAGVLRSQRYTALAVTITRLIFLKN